MHEFSVAQALLDAAVTAARERGARRVTRIRCRIGVLRQINDELMTEAFELVRQGTICADADLAIEKTYLTASCACCGERFPIRDWDWHCPRCGGAGQATGSGGDELELVSLDAEIEE